MTMEKQPFAITLNVGSSLANETGSWRTERPVYVNLLPPCNKACPAGENIQQWLYHAEEGDYQGAHFAGWSMWEKATEELAGTPNLVVDLSSSLYNLSSETAKKLMELVEYIL